MDIAILLALQGFRNGSGALLADFLAKMTFLGELNTTMVILAVMYWCVNKDLGTYMLMGWSGNRLVNGCLKVTACVYRPWIRDPRIVPYGNSMTTATGYSFPSGHSMNASATFGGGVVRKDMPKALRITLALILALVAFSRLFVGVHTPQDVLVGAAAGLLMMWLTLRLTQWLEANPGKDLLVAAVGILLAVLLAFYAGLKSYPTDYDEAGKLLVDGAKMANDTFKGVGWCIAFFVGWILERRFVMFSTDVSLENKLTRLAIGLLGYYAVSLILVPQIKVWIAGPAGTVVSCFVQIFFITFIFPWCISRFEKTE
ncbi:MAG: phosphatase PAP2 family protein [Flexilinea sp.]|nr:phosphatase PAP2 family protein [Flexilinea sp.]